MSETTTKVGQVHVRTAESGDAATVLDVHRRAFGGEVEAELVVQLQSDAAFVEPLSLVAERNGTVVGHVLFTQALAGARRAVLLAPLAVVPEEQRTGVGSALVREGLRRAAELGFELALVLGDPEYYARFGFVPAVAFGILPPYPIEPLEVWMALELHGGVFDGGLTQSVARVAQPFDRPELWGD